MSARIRSAVRQIRTIRTRVTAGDQPVSARRFRELAETVASALETINRDLEELDDLEGRIGDLEGRITQLE